MGVEAHADGRLIDFLPFSIADGMSKCHQGWSAAEKEAWRAESHQTNQGEAGTGPRVELGDNICSFSRHNTSTRQQMTTNRHNYRFSFLLQN